MSMPLSPRIQRSRHALRTALLELLREKAFDQILITEIVREAEVGYATFFRHYAAKEALLHDIASDEIRDLLAMSIPIMSSADSLQSCCKLCTYVFEHRTLWKALLTGGAAGTVRAEFVRQAREWPAERSPARGRVPRDLGTTLSSGATIDALAWWLDQAEPMPAEAIAAIIEGLIISPIVAAVAGQSPDRR